MRKKFGKWIMPLILIVLIPQSVNLVTSYMMHEKQLRALPMAVYLGDQTVLGRQIVRSFDETDTFEVVQYKESVADVEASMERGEVVFGLVIPKDFTKDLKKMKSPTIVTLIDGTQLSTAAFTKIQSTEVLLTTKIGAMISVFKGKYNMSTAEALNIARPVEISSRVLGNPTRNYINFLLPGLITALAQVGMVMVAASLIERGTYKNQKFIKIWSIKWIQIVLLGSASILGILLVQHMVFQVPLRGGFFKLLLMIFLFSSAVVSVGMLLSVIFRDPVFATQAGAVLFIPSSIISGYTWPLVAMPQAIQKFSIILPFTYFGEFLRSWMLNGSYGGYRTSASVLVIMTVFSGLACLLVERLGESSMETGEVTAEYE